MIRLYPTKLKRTDLPELIPTIAALTEKTRSLQNALLNQFDKSEHSNSRRDTIDYEINNLILVWRKKIKALGGTPHAFYEVEFETSNGDYYWKPGQTKPTKIKYKGAV